MRKTYLVAAGFACSALLGSAFALQAQPAGPDPKMNYFVTSKGIGKGGNLGGLAGADQHCQSLAKAAGAGHGVAVALIMGVMTAAAGGLLRDVIANQDPLLLREDVYATAALAGAGAYAALHYTGAPETAAFAVGLAAAFLIRAAAIRFGLHLPRPRR